MDPSDYAILATPAEVSHLIAMGFCNMGYGRIARLEQRVDKRRLASRLSQQNPPIRIWDSSPHDFVEHHYRREFSRALEVGDAFASLFPESAKTVTRYINLATEDASLLGAFWERVRLNGTIETAMLEAKERADQAARKADYLAGALF